MDQTKIEMNNKRRARALMLIKQLDSIKAEIEKLAEEARSQSMEEEATCLDETAEALLEAWGALHVTYVGLDE